VRTSWRRKDKERESEGRQIWSTYFLYVYENRITRPIEIVVRSKGGMRENDGEENLRCVTNM
jgi:hypothetical protein